MGSNEQEPISESELSDLTKAFGACDIDVSGEISDIELKRVGIVAGLFCPRAFIIIISLRSWLLAADQTRLKRVPY